MKQRLAYGVSAAVLTLAILAAPLNVRAQSSGQDEDNGLFILGSVLLSIIHVPYKLVTCAATQASSAVFYTTTYGVRGAYDGETNGRDIGETARRSCTGDWFIKPDQVKKDYGS